MLQCKGKWTYLTPEAKFSVQSGCVKRGKLTNPPTKFWKTTKNEMPDVHISPFQTHCGRLYNTLKGQNGVTDPPIVKPTDHIFQTWVRWVVLVSSPRLTHPLWTEKSPSVWIASAAVPKITGLWRDTLSERDLGSPEIHNTCYRFASEFNPLSDTYIPSNCKPREKLLFPSSIKLY